MLREIATAKINLYLHVTGKRGDGFHTLDSWVVFADTGDILEASKADGVSLSVKGPYGGLVPAENNSVLKAVRALAAEYAVTAGASITLTKNLPIAAGIGGGTADAAAALRLLVRLWNITTTPAKLHALAVTLGSDVPACLRGQSLYMNGAGEKLTKAPNVTGWSLVMVNPGIPLSTREVFAKLPPPYSQDMRHPPEFATQEAAIRFLSRTKNDMQPAAMEMVPQIRQVLEALKEHKGCLLSRMSGSGATCYGIYNEPNTAKNAAMELSRSHPGWWVQEAKLQ